MAKTKEELATEITVAYLNAVGSGSNDSMYRVNISVTSIQSVYDAAIESILKAYEK